VGVMLSRSSMVLVLGVVIAVAVALTLRGRVDDEEASKIKVLSASIDIPAGGFVRGGDHIAFIDWPKSQITDAMVTSDKNKISDFDGAVAHRPLQKGSPVLKNDLVTSHEGGFMSAVLEPGKRAVSIPVDPTSGNAGFIFPGDRVDIILTLMINQNGQQSRASETILEDVRILAIDQMMGNPENKAVLAKTVTLEVTPKQVEEINVAKDLGKLSLSLRSLAPQKEGAAAAGAEAAAPLTFDDVLREAPADPVYNPRITRDTDVSKIMTPRGIAGSVRIIRGGARETVEFGGEDSKDGR
jgi:pilus assembly protein CpaB